MMREMGIEEIGILLSEKDSIGARRSLAPELRALDDAHVHRVADYSGATKAERLARIEEILGICREHGYGHLFAGYGFMAEDEGFIAAIEEGGVPLHRPRLPRRARGRAEGRGQAHRAARGGQRHPRRR